MIIDQKDLTILKVFCHLKTNEEITIWKLMKKIFPNGGEREQIFVRRRITKMAKYGLFKVIPNGIKTTYILNSDNVCLKQFSFPCKRSSAIAILVESKWEAFEL